MVTHGLQTGESVIPFCLQVLNTNTEQVDPPIKYMRLKYS